MKYLSHDPARSVDAGIGPDHGIARCGALGLRASYQLAVALGQIIVARLP